MNYNVTLTSYFKNQIKRLSKKYPKSMPEFENAISELENGNLIGIQYDNLSLPEDQNVYKVMVANIDTKRSAKNGFRFIYYIIKNEYQIYVLSAYSKSEMENLRQSQIKELIKTYCE